MHICSAARTEGLNYPGSVSIWHWPLTNLKISMDNAIGMTVLNTFEDLLNAMTEKQNRHQATEMGDGVTYIYIYIYIYTHMHKYN